MSKRPPIRPAAPVIKSPRVFAIAVWIAPKTLVEQRRRLVAERGNLASQRQSTPRRMLRRIAPTVPIRVIQNCMTLQMVEGQPHCRDRRHANNQRSLHLFWIENRPIESLHAAD